MRASPMSMEEIKDCLYRLNNPAARTEDHHVNERRRLIATIVLRDEEIAYLRRIVAAYKETAEARAALCPDCSGRQLVPHTCVPR